MCEYKYLKKLRGVIKWYLIRERLTWKDSNIVVCFPILVGPNLFLISSKGKNYLTTKQIPLLKAANRTSQPGEWMDSL